MGTFLYTVTYDPNSTATDISDSVLSCSPLSDVGGDEINHAILTLDGAFGAFVTNTNSGATPVLDEFDEIKVSVTDKDSVSYARIFYVETIFKKLNTGEANRIEVHLKGREIDLTDQNIMKKSRIDKPESPFEVVGDLITKYNEKKGSDQVEIVGHTNTGINKAPRGIFNKYDITPETTYHSAISEVLDKLGASVTSGGANEFYETYFTDFSSDETQLIMDIFPSGESGSVIIEQGLFTPIPSALGTYESKTGTVIGAKGANGFGTFPTNLSKFRSIIEAFDLHNQWASGVTYPVDTRIQHNGVHYQAIAENSVEPPNASNWSVITEDDLLNDLQYSPWTEDKAVSIWGNSGSNPEGGVHTSSSDFDCQGCWDSNQVVSDEVYYRDWAEIRSNTTVFDSDYKYALGGDFRGTRILVDTGLGALGGAFTLNGGRDRFGNAYNNHIVQHNGNTFTVSEVYKNWDVIGPRDENGQIAVVPKVTDEVSIDSENKNYVWDGSGWLDISSGSNRNDCFHPYDSISNVQGVSSNITQGAGNYGDTSAVKIEYKYTMIDLGNILRNNVNWYKVGAWLNLKFPLPCNTENGIGESLGELYGGPTPQGLNEPALLDVENYNLTPKGNSGFNSEDSEELGPTESLDFMMKLHWHAQGTTSPIFLSANFNMRCFMEDWKGNVVVQDFVLLFNDNWEDISLPLSGFKPYRARVPIRTDQVFTNLITPELEVLNIFEWQNIKKIGIQTQDSYDSEGRYNPAVGPFGPVSVGILDSVAAALDWDISTFPFDLQFDLYIDAFRFRKQLFALTPNNTTRAIEPRFLQLPDITNYKSLESAALAQKDIEQFRYEAFEIDTELRCDINYGDTFYYRNSEQVTDSDNGANTIKLVAKKIEHSFSKEEGRGGARTKILGVKRIVG